MIELCYYNSKTGQDVTITIVDGETENTMNVTFDFDPPADGETEDTYGIIAKLMAAFGVSGD